MTKYGKIFRKIQLSEWKGRYFDYKRFKQFIKRNNPDNIFPIQKDEKKEKDEKDKEKENDNNVYETLEEKIKYFTDELDKEIKRVYVFFSNKEKNYIKILINVSIKKRIMPNMN